MSRRPTRETGTAAARPCTACGAPLRFSHVTYERGGTQRVVWRCTACGATSEGAPRRRDDDAARAPTSRKPLTDDGPPSNPVFDEDLARRLRDQFGG